MSDITEDKVDLELSSEEEEFYQESNSQQESTRLKCDSLTRSLSSYPLMEKISASTTMGYQNYVPNATPMVTFERPATMTKMTG